MDNDKLLDITDKLEKAIHAIYDVMSEMLSVDNFYTYKQQEIYRLLFAQYIRLSNDSIKEISEMNHNLRVLKDKYTDLYRYFLKMQLINAQNK